MPNFIPDDIDFSAYERGTDCAVKIRPARSFADDVQRVFNPAASTASPAMRSTKLGEAIEFRPGEVTCWAGYSGHRKSMFLGQVALDLMAMRQRCLIVSLEMAPRVTLARMARQGLATNAPEPDELAAFMRWTDDALWIFDHEGRLMPDRCIAVLRYFAQELRGQHVFVDSLMKVVQSEESLDESKRMVGDLCDIAKETGLHVHLVAHCRKPSGGQGDDRPPTKYDLRGSAAISDQCSNVVTVWMNKSKCSADCTSPGRGSDSAIQWDAVVSIEKQRNGEVEGKFGLMFDTRSLRFVNSASRDIRPFIDADGVTV